MDIRVASRPHDASLPHIVYPHAASIFTRIISQLPDLQHTFDSATSALTDAGYKPQISPNAHARLYTVRDSQRIPLASADTPYDPHHLSSSVMFRPIIQDFLFPTIAYVAGPGEIAYIAQLTSLYKQLDCSMPIIWPRCSMTLVDPAVVRLLSDSGLSEQEFLAESLPSPSYLTQAQLQRLVESQNADEQGARKLVERQDQWRKDYLRNYHGADWDDPLSYHLTINTGKVDTDDSVDMIAGYVRRIDPD